MLLGIWIDLVRELYEQEDQKYSDITYEKNQNEPRFLLENPIAKSKQMQETCEDNKIKPISLLNRRHVSLNCGHDDLGGSRKARPWGLA